MPRRQPSARLAGRALRLRWPAALVLTATVVGAVLRMFDRRAVGVAAAWFIAMLPWYVHRSGFAIHASVVDQMRGRRRSRSKARERARSTEGT